MCDEYREKYGEDPDMDHDEVLLEAARLLADCEDRQTLYGVGSEFQSYGDEPESSQGDTSRTQSRAQLAAQMALMQRRLDALEAGQQNVDARLSAVERVQHGSTPPPDDIAHD